MDVYVCVYVYLGSDWVQFNTDNCSVKEKENILFNNWNSWNEKTRSSDVYRVSLLAAYLLNIVWWINPTIRRMQINLVRFSFRLLFGMCQTYTQCFSSLSRIHSVRKCSKFKNFRLKRKKKHNFWMKTEREFLIFIFFGFKKLFFGFRAEIPNFIIDFN